MNLIFLDIDGVLNSVESMIRRKRERDGADVENREDRDDWPDETLVARLNRLIHATESCVVISSSWRILTPYDKLKAFLVMCGIPEPVIIGATPRFPGKTRGTEIKHWLYEHRHEIAEFDNFVILDDDSDMAPFMSHLVKTKNAVGLQDADVEKAIRILKGEYAE